MGFPFFNQKNKNNNCNNAVLKFSPGRTDFTLVLKIRCLVFADIDAEFHKACFALSILLFTSASPPPSVKWQHYFQTDLKEVTCIGKID